ncbi:MAG: PP0621 family protein [Burkholderiaceae bacterium]
MARILLFIFLAFLCWLAIRVLGGSRKRDDAPGDAPQPDAAPLPKSVERVTQCAWCGVHVPRGEVVSLPDGRVYCSEAHRETARQSAAPVDRPRT